MKPIYMWGSGIAARCVQSNKTLLFSLTPVTQPHIFNLNPHLHLFHGGPTSARSCTILGTRRPANAHLCRSMMSRLATSGGR